MCTILFNFAIILLILAMSILCESINTIVAGNKYNLKISFQMEANLFIIANLFWISYLEYLK